MDQRTQLEHNIRFAKYEQTKWERKLLDASLLNPKPSKYEEHQKLCRHHIARAKAKISGYQALLELLD